MSDLESRWRAVIAGEECAWWAPLARGGLAAVAALYGCGALLYRAAYDRGLLPTERLPRPVVSVGNLTVGGTGKTTTVRWLVRRLLARGLRPAILSYGYRPGGSRKTGGNPHGGRGVSLVADPEGLRQPVEVSGDEPQLLARSLPGVPVLIGKRRADSGRLALTRFEVDVFVLDDAFQYRRLHRDLDIVLVNASEPFGYGRLFPRGTLREPPDSLRRADAAIVTHAGWLGPAERDALRRALLEQNPRLVLAETRHAPVRLRDATTGETVPLAALRDGRWLALSSLGHPESFERTLRELGARDPAPARFRDHHAYTEDDFRSLTDRLHRERLAGVVTTEKDSVKIATEWLSGVRCLVLEIDLQFLSGEDEIDGLLRSRAAAAPARRTAETEQVDEAPGVVAHPASPGGAPARGPMDPAPDVVRDRAGDRLGGLLDDAALPESRPG